MSYLPAVNLPGNVSYCLASRQAAQNVTAGGGAVLIFDAITFASPDFVVSPGDNGVKIVTPGTYLAIADVYPTSTPLATGAMRALVGAGDGDVFGTGSLCPADLSANGAALAFDFIVTANASIATPSLVSLTASQTDNVDRDLSGDLLIIRLPGNSA